MKVLLSVAAIAFACVTGADEPWMYPVSDTPPPTDVKSLSLTHSYVEVRGVRISDSLSRVVNTDVAAFDAIVKWYSEKVGSPELTNQLTSYHSRSAKAPFSRQGHANRPGMTSPTIIYSFTPAHKLVTIVPLEDDGGTVAVSLLGTETETTIQVVRRHPRGEPK